METSEALAEIRDLVVIVFLLVALIAIVFGSALFLRMYGRINHLMDKVENAADEVETTFGKVASARRSVEEAVDTLQPVANALTAIAGFTGLTRLFGGKKTRNDAS